MTGIEKIPDSELALMNRKLDEWYGRTDEHQNFRVVWSEDQLEKRLVDHTKEGLQLLRPIVEERPKYKQWIEAKYLIERLTVVPQFIKTDMIEKLSYEPLYVFELNKGEFVRPSLAAIRFVIENVLEAMRLSGYKKYKEPNGEESLEEQKIRIDKLQEELFGNETEVNTALSHASGVGYGQSSSPNSARSIFKSVEETIDDKIVGRK